MSRILGVGIATLDIINSVDHYPQEDEELRTLEQRMVRGGNCTNTLVTLSQLGDHCAWAGTLSDEPNASLVRDEMDHYHIDQSALSIIPGARLPTSYITLNRQNGSRTIVHHRELPEYGFADFAKIDLAHYDWIHFEGRNVDQLLLMLQYMNNEWPQLPVSLEVEKPRPGIEALFTYARVLLFSRVYARHQGYEDGQSFLQTLAEPDQRSFCGWGNQGAYARQTDNVIFVPATAPGPIVDTIGAGDVFNAGIIHALAAGQSVKQALTFAVTLAGEHCCRPGFAFSR